jgi:hypothetical protein
MRLYRIAFAFLVLSVNVAGSQEAGDEAILNICEELIADRLLSPVSYDRLSAVKSVERVGFDEYWSTRIWVNDPEARRIRERHKALYDPLNSPYKATTFLIKYDAANGYGVLIRRTSTCRYLSDGEPSGHPDVTNVTVDGETNLVFLRRIQREAMGFK